MDYQNVQGERLDLQEWAGINRQLADGLKMTPEQVNLLLVRVSSLEEDLVDDVGEMMEVTFDDDTRRHSR